MYSKAIANILHRGDLHDQLFSYMSDVELARMSLTCVELHEAVVAYFERAYDLTRALEKYMLADFIGPFRSMQHASGAVISGSFALKFMGRLNFSEGDLDLYVPHENAVVVAAFLESLGYSYSPRSAQEKDFELAATILQPAPPSNEEEAGYRSGSPYRSTIDAFTFMRDGVKVQIMTCRYGVVKAVLGFHSTAVMNIITCDSGYSLYPRETFENKRTLASYSPSLHGIALAKYERRGWLIVLDPVHTEVINPRKEFGRLFRYVGDDMTRVVTIPKVYVFS
ncbi:hypothetical protein BD626DRAFT_399153 [Schizophyllum amplum]|uniref:Uncharacterized protein n=1 Tax=Schizophyllum amplum TaxID=97359 RepID=A0A550CKD9_9AGAR|nr:hypothetical protein BD626DRAFT_399153 [Auriculariopsis ampla]